MSRDFEASLTDISGRSSIGRAHVVDVDMNERFKRAAKRGLAFFGVAIVFLPVPLIHFVLPPIFLIVSIAAFVTTFRQTRIVPSIDGTCPACGAIVEFKNHRFDGHQKDVCPSCRQHLKIQFS
ncbi:MAG: hypothetical protein V4760_15845 [Bdellovibrionota bacterium]